MPCHSTRGSTRTAASAHVCPRVVVGSPESRGCASGNPRCSLQELSCPQARGRRQGQVVSAQDLPAPAEPHGGPDQTEPLQELPTAGSCYGEGDARPAEQQRKKGCVPSLSAEPAAPGWSREAALELCCSGPRRRLRRTGTGERSPPWPHSDSARWTPFRKERTLRPPAGHGPALTANAANPAARGKTGSWESGQPSPFCISPCPWTQHLLMGLGRAAGIRCT